MTPADAAAVALDDLVDQLCASAAVFDDTATRAKAMLARRREGASWQDILVDSPRPLIVELMTAELERLTYAAGQWRRMNARALHGEGLTMDKIAELFGISRQRVSILLQSTPQSGPSGGTAVSTPDEGTPPCTG